MYNKSSNNYEWISLVFVIVHAAIVLIHAHVVRVGLASEDFRFLWSTSSWINKMKCVCVCGTLSKYFCAKEIVCAKWRRVNGVRLCIGQSSLTRGYLTLCVFATLTIFSMVSDQMSHWIRDRHSKISFCSLNPLDDPVWPGSCVDSWLHFEYPLDRLFYIWHISTIHLVHPWRPRNTYESHGHIDRRTSSCLRRGAHCTCYRTCTPCTASHSCVCRSSRPDSDSVPSTSGDCSAGTTNSVSSTR